ncbi:MAG: NAD(P)/FAD-dependent oxidoreductase [Planctomycetaceae bacterium]|nr:MAG: NAD(P)/FAD-dependent oxidoreductase [Planctomycetaceae bacterium]
MSYHQVVIVGGGMAGLAVADRLVKESAGLQVAIFEPSVKHDYQHIWLMVAGGVIEPKAARRDKATLIPAGATWIQDSVEAFYPGYNSLVTAVGQNISYEYLVVAPGMQVNWDGVVSLRETIGKDGVWSIYSHETAASHGSSCGHSYRGSRCSLSRQG